MSSALDRLYRRDIDCIEITLTHAQLIDMPRAEKQAYEALFRAAFDRGLWVTHWDDVTFRAVHYVISRSPGVELADE